MTPATDIYSIGVMFYELTTLRPPYLSDNPLELENLHRFGAIPSARNINNGISSGIDGIIRKAMQKDPKDRYQTAEEMLKDIKTIKTDAPSLSGMGDVLELASKIYSKREQVKAQQEKKDRQNTIMTSKCLYKIGEFINKVQGVLEVFNQNFPQEKVLLSKGTETDYTLIWKGADLIRFRFNPHLFSMKLTIGGNKLSAYGYAKILNGHKNEGLNFILVDLDESDSYGTWKALEVTGSPLVPNQPHYSVAVELEVIERISKLGNAMDIWQHTVREIKDFNEEIINLIKKSLEYLKILQK